MIRLPLLVALCFSLTCTMNSVQSADKKQKKHTLPKDPKAAVIVLEYQGGFTAPRTNNEPPLTILADGTVILGAPFGQRKRIEAGISQNQLQELLRFILDEQKMATFNSTRVKKAVRAAQKKRGAAIRIADAATPVLRVQADGKRFEAKYYALSMMALQYPEIKSLARFDAVRKRLERFQGEIYAGGRVGLIKHLALVNKKLETDNPEVPALKAEDLKTASQLTNGRMFVNFFRTEKLGKGVLRHTTAYVTIPADGKTQVNANVTVRPGK